MRGRAERTLAIGLLCVAVLACACGHRPAPYRPLDRPSVASAISCIDEGSAEPRLQVLVVYGGIRCNHVAVRLTGPSHPPLFWDPGGHYGVGRRPVIRRRNLIVDEAPDIALYTRYLWQKSAGLLEIFEWDLPPELADELYAVLHDGTPASHPAGEFTTPTPAFFCSSATSDFLRRFVSELVTVSDEHFFPHDLARELHASDPSRIFYVPRRGDAERLGPPRPRESSCP